MAIIHEQLNALAANVQDWSKIVIVYEPVWAVEMQMIASADQV